ncbi:MAG TPA: chromosomal replication initiator protein DnaA [Phycisphaerae bacterium]|nr:chromosomal replication initiator protein DnaA [Phycisphaerae bacterium]HPP20619.1 chromosomal replication initiator protein DnaA [Phycisphaerae bacterium]
MSGVSERTWSDVLVQMRAGHPELFRPWFSALEPLGMQSGVIQVATDSPSHHRYLTQQCQRAFSQAAQAVTGRLITVEFVPPATPQLDEAPLSFETEELRLNESYTFENFVTGPCNRLAHAACFAAAEAPGRTYNPLFVHGAVGLGKTHLLQAVCHHILQNNPQARVLYISCETFSNHFVEAIERGALHQFRYLYRHVDALVIDDIQFLGTKERTREEFFHTFNTLYQAQKQIVLSADEAPNVIPSLEDRLVSRFNWGLVTRIDPPGLETRMAILSKKAKLRCMSVPDDVIHYLATIVESNTRELEGSLTKLAAFSQQYGGIINLEIAHQAFGDAVQTPARKISIPDIVQAVVERFGVRSADLLGKRRNRSVAFPRQVCMYLARELTTLSLEEIGGYFGGRDHTTVLHAIRTIQNQRNQDPELELMLRGLIGALRKQSVYENRP